MNPRQWQPGEPGPAPGNGRRPTRRSRRSVSQWLKPARLLTIVAAGVLAGMITIPDQLAATPVGDVGQASAGPTQAAVAKSSPTGQPTATPTKAPTPVPVPAALRANIDPSLPVPAGIQTTGLSTTLRVNWTPATGASVAWQLVSIWDGATLMGEKVLGATAAAADGNGLQPNHAYTVAVQSVSAAGHLSNPLVGAGATDQQSPMHNAVFFENFEDAAPGPLDPNYFDVRLRDGETSPDIADKARAFVSEHHFHTELISGEGDMAVSITPRGIFDFANRVGTFQFEVDMAGVQSIPGKWFEIHLSKHAPTDAQFFGLATNEQDVYPDDLSFSIARPINANDNSNAQQAAIAVNSGGQQKLFLGRSNNFTGHNVRVPVVLKVSTTSAEMFINGESVARATGLNLAFTRGQWTIAHRGFYAPRSPSFPAYLQLIHWDTVQFDGPDGGFSPVRKTYFGPDCPTQKTAFQMDCIVDANSPVTVNIPDAASSMTSARLLFNPFDLSGSCDHAQYTVNATVNGHAVSVPSQPQDGEDNGEHCYDQNLASAEIPASWLKQGDNVVKMGRQTDQLEIEAAFSTPRVIALPSAPSATLLGVTNDNLLTGHPAGTNTVDLTTYLFSQGVDTPVNYQVVNKTGSQTPWMSVLTPTSGTIRSLATGGSLVPITVRIDFSKVDRPSGTQMPAVLWVTGNVFISIAYDTAPTYDYAVKSFTPLMTTFNKSAIPDYHGTGSGNPPPPTLPPTAPPTPNPSPSGCKP